MVGLVPLSLEAGDSDGSPDADSKTSPPPATRDASSPDENRDDSKGAVASTTRSQTQDQLDSLLQSDPTFFPESGTCLTGFITYRAPESSDDDDGDDYRYAPMIRSEDGISLGLVAHDRVDRPNGDDRVEWMGLVRAGAWWGAAYPPGDIHRKDSTHLERAQRGWTFLQAVESSFKDGTFAEDFRIAEVRREGDVPHVAVLKPTGMCATDWHGLSVTEVRVHYTDTILRVSVATAAGRTHRFFSGKTFTRKADDCLEVEGDQSWPKTAGGDIDEAFVNDVRKTANSND